MRFNYVMAAAGLMATSNAFVVDVFSEWQTTKWKPSMLIHVPAGDACTGTSTNVNTWDNTCAVGFAALNSRMHTDQM
jgi:hypothetical protein